MNNITKYRGFNGAEWVYGTAVYEDGDFTSMMVEVDDWVYVRCLGRSIGLVDKKGTEIFENDILRRDGHWDLKVVWDALEARFVLTPVDSIVGQHGRRKFTIDRFELVDYWEVVDTTHDFSHL